MTDKKPTVSLGPDEWRALVASNLRSGIAFVEGNALISPENFALFNEHLERIKGFVAAWHVFQPPAPKQEAQMPAQAQHNPNYTNGHSEPKRKGGWPRGKSRKAPATGAMQ